MGISLHSPVLSPSLGPQLAGLKPGAMDKLPNYKLTFIEYFICFFFSFNAATVRFQFLSVKIVACICHMSNSYRRSYKVK